MYTAELRINGANANVLTFPFICKSVCLIQGYRLRIVTEHSIAARLRVTNSLLFMRNPIMPGTQLTSRRDVIRYGLFAAATSCGSAYAESTGPAEAAGSALSVDGAFGTESGSYSVDAATDAIHRNSEEFSGIHDAKKVQVVNSLGQSHIRFRREAGLVSHVAKTNGYLVEAKPNPDGTQVAFIEQDGDVQRLIVAHVGKRKRIVCKESESTSLLQGIAWSPCGRYVAAVGFDWESTGDGRGYPAPNSYRIELFDGRSRTTRCRGAAWLGNIQWVS